jgi:uncharacterized protein (TIGR02145 family)
MKEQGRIIHIMVIMAVVFCSLNSCTKDGKVVLDTEPITEAGLTTAICGGKISSDGGYSISERGVCWAEFDYPTLIDSKTSDGSGTGAFSSHMTGLKPNTKYFVRAYAITSAGTKYAESVSFSTFNVIDYDGNGYNTVKIGTQEWTVQNLKVTHFQNGDVIFNVAEPYQWFSTTAPSYCYFDNDLSKVSVYGNLYNFYTAVDSRNVCPDGWHVPSKDEWTTLINYFGNQYIADARMREAGTAHWYHSTGADNSSGFTFLPVGIRDAGGYFYGMTYNGSIWTSTESTDINGIGGWMASMYTDHSEVVINSYSKSNGAAIRCVKD